MQSSIPKIGAITIGQAPRDDIMKVMTPHLPAGLQILQRGALDDLDPSAIAGLRAEIEFVHDKGARQDNHDGAIEYEVLVSRLRDGSEAMMTHNQVVPLMQEKINALEADGVEIIVLLCGGDFPELCSNKIILHPGKLLRGAVESVAFGSKLGIVMPSDAQVTAAQSDAKDRWGAREVHVTFGSPYLPMAALDSEWKRVGQEMSTNNVDIVFLNCMGMDEQMRAIVRKTTSKPVLLLSSVLARTLAELIN